MKKIFGIIVLSLLLSGNVYANKIPDMKNSVWVILDGTKFTYKFEANGRCSYTYRDIFMKTKTDCQWTQNGNKVTIKPSNNYWTRQLSISGYDATGSFSNRNGRVDALTAKASYIENWLSTSSNSISTSNTNDKITQSKQICKDLGFKVKTEKFADCALQMMSIQFETTNKVASASGGTTQEVIVTHRNDYDIWDALLDFSAAIDPKNKTTTSSSSSNRGTNCVVGRTNPTFGTTTINCR